MLMRHRGGDVGHKNTWHLNEMLLGNVREEDGADIDKEDDKDSEMGEIDKNIKDEISDGQESGDEDDLV